MLLFGWFDELVFTGGSRNWKHMVTGRKAWWGNVWSNKLWFVWFRSERGWLVAAGCGWLVVTNQSSPGNGWLSGLKLQERLWDCQMRPLMPHPWCRRTFGANKKGEMPQGKKGEICWWNQWGKCMFSWFTNQDVSWAKIVHLTIISFCMKDFIFFQNWWFPQAQARKICSILKDKENNMPRMMVPPFLDAAVLFIGKDAYAAMLQKSPGIEVMMGAILQAARCRRFGEGLKNPGVAEKGKAVIFPSLPPYFSLCLSFSMIFWFLLGWKSPELNGNMWDMSCWLDLCRISVCKYTSLIQTMSIYINYTYNIYLYVWIYIHTYILSS